MQYIMSCYTNIVRKLVARQQQKMTCRNFATYSSSNDIKQRLRRTVHFVPADNTKFLRKSLSLGADTIVLDLEDSVKDKTIARDTLSTFLQSNMCASRDKDTTEVLVRINPLSTEMWEEDIEVGFLGNVDGFMIPKVESQDELAMLDEVLSDLEAKQNDSRRKILLPIATEKPNAVLNIAGIAKSPRVAAITWGCEDLSAEIGSFGTHKTQSPGEYLDVFRYCQSMCLLAAKAAGVQAIDGIYQNVRDIVGFENDVTNIKLMGFDGKLTLHPDQISAVHKVFEPTTDELNNAVNIVRLWEEEGSLEYDGKMIDAPHYVRAKKVIARSTKKRVNMQSDSNNASRNNETTVSMSSSSQKSTSKQQNTATNIDDTQDEIFPRVYMGKYYEDLEPGLKIRHFLTRTVTESDNVFFTCLTLNPAPIHLDHELAKENSKALSGDAEGKPLFNSMFTLALLVGMSVPEATHGTTIANLGFSEVIFPKPVYPGDTLRAETIVLDRRESKSRPTQGIVTLQHLAHNQRGEVVCKATRQALMKKKKGS